ncbi:putative carboxymethylenebutenolidase [Gordonia araii NBRC 100433]|uniref:Putative carboxymethylenebutenolidase n=1 Tax=Gordonia araii NBRC 100433 TaxID=1073574 RepID=G7GZ04_9ACTN|nr:dienelactone hydrolase family protein [Gordonia araii]NNG97037.1 dienelactone hydrolase family protein [Gordonia araii NBRC 100433]GAB08829.1 putative carboxymethylenebutenolidase [Gordonia araii NBRC 100433]
MTDTTADPDDLRGRAIESDDSEHNVTFDSGGRTVHGFLKLPPSGSGPGVIVIQEWWGLTTHVADLTRRFAAEGFVALAPDLFGGRTTHDSAEAAGLLEALPVDQAAADLSGAVDYLLERPEVVGDAVSAVGFCMGGGFVLVLAAQQAEKIAKAVPFYGLPSVPQDYRNLKARVLGHYAETDEWLDRADIDAVAEQIARESGQEVTFHFYPAGHAFLNDENLLGTYDAEQADLAWRRTIEFLRDA